MDVSSITKHVGEVDEFISLKTVFSARNVVSYLFVGIITSPRGVFNRLKIKVAASKFETCQLARYSPSRSSQ